MDTWVLQMNYPIVNVEFTEEGKITLTQKRFVTNIEQSNSKTPKSPYGYVNPKPLLEITHQK